MEGTVRGYRAMAMPSIEGQRHRHSPSIGIRVAGIGGCERFFEVDSKVGTEF